MAVPERMEPVPPLARVMERLPPPAAMEVLPTKVKLAQPMKTAARQIWNSPATPDRSARIVTPATFAYP